MISDSKLIFEAYTQKVFERFLDDQNNFEYVLDTLTEIFPTNKTLLNIFSDTIQDMRREFRAIKDENERMHLIYNGIVHSMLDDYPSCGQKGIGRNEVRQIVDDVIKKKLAQQYKNISDEDKGTIVNI